MRNHKWHLLSFGLGDEAGGVADGAGVEVLGNPMEGDGGFAAKAAGDLGHSGTA